MQVNIFGLYQVIHIVLLLNVCFGNHIGECDRRPLGTKSTPLPPDNRFAIEIKAVRHDMYMPKMQYEVRLFSRNKVSPFIAFTISLRGDTSYNKNNPRKPFLMKPGILEPYSNNTKYLHGCENTIIQSDITPKTEVKAMWTAPDKDNKCVTIFAVVAVQPDVWYSYEGPLSKQLCEDRRKAEDMQPMQNDNCDVCDDARYQLTFQGMWSHNTHPLMYPQTQELARFSDVVGASHNNDFALYKYNSEASLGLKMLAEQGNTTKLELEILDSLTTDIENSRVRTLIKATAPPSPNLSTLADLRVTRHHHLVSIATAILPSPDWYLGVSNLELCDARTKYWAENITLNLYPMDAGTDSGKTFEASNEETSPHQPISSAEIVPGIAKEEIKPFARLLLRLIRTYTNPNCTERDGGAEESGTESGQTSSDRGETGDGSDSKPDYRPSSEPTPTTSEEPPSPDPDLKSSDCPMTTWSEWDVCEGDCVDKKVTGYQTRFRQHLQPNAECTTKMTTEDFQSCEEECQEEEPEEEAGEEEEE